MVSAYVRCVQVVLIVLQVFLNVARAFNSCLNYVGAVNLGRHSQHTINEMSRCCSI